LHKKRIHTKGLQPNEDNSHAVSTLWPTEFLTKFMHLLDCVTEFAQTFKRISNYQELSNPFMEINFYLIRFLAKQKCNHFSSSGQTAMPCVDFNCCHRFHNISTVLWATCTPLNPIIFTIALSIGYPGKIDRQHRTPPIDSFLGGPLLSVRKKHKSKTTVQIGSRKCFDEKGDSD
jgi:hypothetical protein